ncbi:hypothetical protein NPX13_g10043 [Xylaria arbuscula]|uniref:Uncharacterized protein n=1 Tax=Xylaria arbuscula TaxID=114810 RepID=A0A9W8N5K6_9PEZI|nr:hypothetical protein NPX13_g10043 [Xylaria arbuscula]
MAGNGLVTRGANGDGDLMDTTSRSREPIEDETLEIDEILRFHVSSFKCGWRRGLGTRVIGGLGALRNDNNIIELPKAGEDHVSNRL